MPSRRRGYRSWRLQAFHDDPQLLSIGPAPPSAGLNDLKPFNLSTVLMAVHKDCYTSLNLTQQGGLRRRDTCREADSGMTAGVVIIAGALHRPLVVLLEQDRSDQPDDGVLLGEGGEKKKKKKKSALDPDWSSAAWRDAAAWKVM